MILVFQQGSSVIRIKIDGRKVYCAAHNTNWKYLPIENLFNIDGILKEYPDLVGMEKDEIIKVGANRWQEKIDNFNNQEEIIEYIEKELKQTQGFMLVDVGGDND